VLVTDAAEQKSVGCSLLLLLRQLLLLLRQWQLLPGLNERLRREERLRM
jgi:hypothetical protein